MGHKAAGRVHRPIDRTNPAIPQFDIQEWLKDDRRLVTRRELYEFISRLEHGRARAQRLHRRVGWAIGTLARKVWTYLKRSPLETDEKVQP
ncbi:MAG TPA: hypothetical protein VEU74_12035 [Gemmatimonadales bacterium]|nr:hypothetical protein [Gemmatimonadales bacterium]